MDVCFRCYLVLKACRFLVLLFVALAARVLFYNGFTFVGKQAAAAMDEVSAGNRRLHETFEGVPFYDVGGG